MISLVVVVDETDSEVEDEMETGENVPEPLGGAGTDILRPLVGAGSAGDDLLSSQNDMHLQDSDIRYS